MARFRDIKTLQKFASVHSSVYNHFNHQRNLNRRHIFKQTSGCRFGRVAPTGSLKFIVKKFRRSNTSYSDSAVWNTGCESFTGV